MSSVLFHYIKHCVTNLQNAILEGGRKGKKFLSESFEPVSLHTNLSSNDQIFSFQD